jgi:hypothetical protein
MIIIGFDSEFVRRGDRNEILSYQYAIKTKEKTQSGIFYPEQGHRWTIKKFLEEVIQAGRSEGTLDRVWPKELYLVAHFSRADVSMLKDYKRISRSLDSLRGTYATLGRPLVERLHDRNRNQHSVKVHLRDTMTIAPTGTSLEAVGELLGLQKISLPKGAIEAMDKLLKDDPILFAKYAIRDAEIAAEFAWKLAEFKNAEGLSFDIPITLGSLAIKLVEDLWRESNVSKLDVLGKEEVREQKYVNGRYRTESHNVLLAQVHEFEGLATECYHGGRNEAFFFGPTDFDWWTDIDLAGAYSTAMAAIRIPDWRNLYPSQDLSLFTKDALGLARVQFKFPETCQYPCLPVRTDNGLIFPLEGQSYCGSPEIELALSMGAEVQIELGVIVPWASEVRPFDIFSRKVREKRKSYDKGSIFEKTWKEIGNSLYGKVAQGLRNKRVFDSRSNESSELPPSEVTQPYLAAYITSIVRATLGELLVRIPSDKVNISATTDGFITNATRSELDLTGPLCSFFAEQAERLTGDTTMVEVKHVVPQVVCMKTRGQLTAGVLDFELNPIKAKAGVQVPRETLPEATGPKDHQENDWMLELFLMRTPSTTVRARQLTSMRTMHLKNTELYMEEYDKRISLEFDWKRELVEPRMVLVGQVINGENPVHISCWTKPHKTVQDFQLVRQQFDDWRKTHSLQTMTDWQNWVEFRQRKSLKASGHATGNGALADQCRRQFLRAFASDEEGIKDCTYAELSDWLTQQGYNTSVTDLKNAKRSAVEVTDWSTINDEKTVKFLTTVRQRYQWPKV